MKKWVKVVGLFLTFMMPAVVQADDFTYTTNNGAITITGYTGSGGAVTITNNINGLPVTSIGTNSFYDCTNLTAVTIPNGVTNIGSYAFAQCTSMTNIAIPTSVVRIGAFVFNRCYSITSIIIPSNVTSIGNSPAASCTNLTSITVNEPNGFYCSVDGVLFNKSQTSLIQYPAGEPASGYTIPSSVTRVGGYAFSLSTKLTNITIPDSVTNIALYSFRECTSLTNVIIPNSVISIEGSAFQCCSNLTSVTIGTNVASIGDFTFNQCALTSVTISDSVTSLGYNAFSFCTNLTSVTIGTNVTYIGVKAFESCSSLTDLTIPDSVTFLGHHAFWRCPNLTSVIIGNGITNTEVGTFQGSALTNLTMGTNVTTIGDYAFKGGLSLSSLVIPDSVTVIGYEAFAYCPSLTSVTIATNVTDIGDRAFYYCPSLTEVYFLGNAPSLGGTSVFSNTINATIYYLPNTTGWTNPWGGLPTAPWESVTITNLVVSQRPGTKLVNIIYDVFSTYTNRVWISLTTICTSAVVNAISLTGDIGEVSVGTNKSIVWDAEADWNGNIAGVSFILTPTEIPPPQGMVLIPAGTNSGTDPDYGAYSLSVANPFYMDATEVTKAQWDAVYSWALTNGYSFDNAGLGNAADHPVQTVSWYDCVKWCNARSEKEGRTPCYSVSQQVYRTGQFGTNGSDIVSCSFTANGYRLPTVAEWEYAARGGLSGKRFPWGDVITHSNANYFSSTNYNYDVSSTRGYHPTYASGGMPYTSPTGSFVPTGYGLYDMAGNVMEWCWDLSGSSRYRHSGSWRYYAHGERCGYKFVNSPDYDYYDFGFRAICRPDEIDAVASSPSAATAAMDTRDYALSVSSTHGMPVPSVGTHNYARFASVTCSAENITSDGWMFMGWTGDVSTDYTATNIVVVMDALSKNVAATFSDDADSDGLLNTDETALGTNPRSKDSDADGMDDSPELIAGTSPTNSASILSVTCTFLSNGQKRLSWFGVQGRAYTFQYSDSLKAEWQSYPFEVPGSDFTIAFLDTATLSNRFYRVKVRIAD